MKKKHLKCRPGEVRDAIVRALRASPRARSAKELAQAVSESIGGVAASSVRSYLRLNTPGMFVREFRGVYRLRDMQMTLPVPRAALRRRCGRRSRTETPRFIAMTVSNGWNARMTTPSTRSSPTRLTASMNTRPEQQAKLRNGKGGVWRIPPSFDGTKRSPLPRFTTLTPDQLEELREFFRLFGRALLPKLTPGANVVVASNPLLSHIVADGLSQSGLERRGELVRLVMTLRGGDRPKAAHEEFSQVSVMPRSMWEPWLIYRKPLEGRAQDNLRKWQTGGFRRPSPQRPFGDVIRSSPTRKEERLAGAASQPQAAGVHAAIGARGASARARDRARSVRRLRLDAGGGGGGRISQHRGREGSALLRNGVQGHPEARGAPCVSTAPPALRVLSIPTYPSLRAPHIKSQFSGQKESIMKIGAADNRAAGRNLGHWTSELGNRREELRQTRRVREPLPRLRGVPVRRRRDRGRPGRRDEAARRVLRRLPGNGRRARRAARDGSGSSARAGRCGSSSRPPGAT